MAGDDLSGDYVRDAAMTQQANAAASLMARVEAKRAAAKPAGAAEAAATTGRLQFNPAEVRAGYAAIGNDLKTGLSTDLPRAFATGFRDGVQEMVDLGRSAGEWLDKNVADIDLLESAGMPKAAKFVKSDQLPDPGALVGETQSTTGGIIKAGVQFLTGFKAAGKVIKGSGFAAATAKSAASSFAAFDGHEQNLANLWQTAGLPQNILTDYLASSPDDTDIEGRFKNALADAGLGTLVEGISIGARALRTARLARQAPIQAPDTAGASAMLPQTTAKDFDILGDLTQDKVIGKKLPPEFDPGVSMDVVAKGISGSAQDAAAASAAAHVDSGKPFLGRMEVKGNKRDYTLAIKNDDPSIETVDGNRPLAFVETTIDGDTIRIDSITSVNANKSGSAQWTVGPKQLADLAAALAKDNPGAKWLTGDRVSGIRFGGGNAERNAFSGSPEGGAELRIDLSKVSARGKGELPVIDYADFDRARSKAKSPEAGVKPHEPEFFINWARIDQPDDVKNVMAQMADAFRPEIDAARGRPGGEYLISPGLSYKGKVYRGETHNDAVEALQKELGAVPDEDALTESFGYVTSKGRVISDEDAVKIATKTGQFRGGGTTSESFDFTPPRVSGKVTFEEIKLDAAQENAWKILTERRQGEPLSAEKMTAARTLWASSTSKLTEMAKLAENNPSDANLLSLKKMVDIHRMIQSEVVAARTETARALTSMRIPITSDALRHREINEIIQASGGSSTMRSLASAIADAARRGNPHEVEQLVERSWGAKTVDAVKEHWLAGLLWNPATWVANMVSNTAVLANTMGERAVAARIGRAFGDPTSVQAGEVTAQWAGLIGGMKDHFRFGWQAIKGAESGLSDKFGISIGGSKIDDGRPPAISSGATGVAKDGWLGRAIDGYGTAVRTPFRMLAGGDEFFKSAGASMEHHALATRIAKQEAAAGAIKPSMIKDRINEILHNPDDTVKMAVADQALYQTFNNAPGKFAQWIMQGKQKFPALNVLLPFVRTPANIFNYTAERTPIAPLMSRFRADVAAGGARRDLALTKMATGTMVMLTVADMAMEGNITGGGPANADGKALRERMGIQNYSIKVGGRYYSFNRLDPIGLTFAMAADAVELMHNTEWDRNDTKTEEEIVYAITGAIANSTMSKFYMRGLSEFFTGVANARGGGMQRFLEGLAGSVTGSGLPAIERQIDPYLREADGMLQTIRSRTPGLSADLPVSFDLWGRPKSYESGLGWGYDAFSPIYSRRFNPEPIDLEIQKHEMNIQDQPHRQSFDGVPVDLDRYPGAYSRFRELAGNEVKHPAWGMGLKDLLNATVEGKSPLSEVYRLRSDGPDGGKEAWVKDKLGEFNALARTQLLVEFPAIAEGVAEKKRVKQKRELEALTRQPVPDSRLPIAYQRPVVQ